MRLPGLALLALVVAVQLTESKKASGTLKLSSADTEQYISKFAFTGKPAPPPLPLLLLLLLADHRLRLHFLPLPSQLERLAP